MFPPDLRRWGPLLAVGALLATAAIASALSSPQITDVPLPQPPPETIQGTQQQLPSLAAPPTGADEPAGALAMPAWLADLAVVVCGLIVLAIVLAVVWVIVRNTISVRRGALRVDTGPVSSLVPRTDDVVAALDAGLSDLSDSDRDPRRVVIACWVRLEQAAAAAGTPRHPGDTPSDLVLRLLNAHQVDRRVLDRFAETYREARYATHVIDDRMRSQARSALRQLRQELITAPEAAPS